MTEYVLVQNGGVVCGRMQYHQHIQMKMEIKLH